MEWFTGGVVEAIAASRRDKALFLVYVHDDGAASTAMNEAWKSDRVREALSGNQAVAIQIAKGSLEHQQFSQISSFTPDPVFIFPSVFCIGLTGNSLVIMNGQQSTEDLHDKLKEAFQKLQEESGVNKPTAPTEATSTQPETPPTQPEAPPTTAEVRGTVSSQPLSQPHTSPTGSVESESAITGEAEEEEKDEAGEGEREEVGEGERGEVGEGERDQSGEGEREEVGEGERDKAGEEERSEAAGVSQQESREEKIEKAQQKIRQRRREREEAEFQKQKLAELKRREEGRELGEAKNDLEVLRRRTWIHERKKAKEEERAAKEAIRAKLRQDKLEREAQRRARDQQANASLTDGVVRQRPVSSSPTNSLSAAGMCRIQLRLPSGQRSVVEMKSQEKLGALRLRIAEEVGMSEEGLVLSSTFPLRELTPEMDEQTLGQLGLAPSAAVAIRFTRGSRGRRDNGSEGTLRALFTYLLGLLLSFVALIKKTFCPRGKEDGDDDLQTDTRSYQKASSTNRKGGAVTGQERKVHRFMPTEFDEDSSDDEERRNTYNGNSTEQQ